MSFITDAILYPGINEFLPGWSAVLEHITFAYEDGRRHTSWRRVDMGSLEADNDYQLAGGNKVLTVTFWAGAYNHLPPDNLVARIRSAPWPHPHEWVALINDEEQAPTPTVYWQTGQHTPTTTTEPECRCRGEFHVCRPPYPPA